MEGLNIGGILLGYAAVFVFGGACLIALVLLIARQTTPARIVFAAGLLCAMVAMAVAVLSFLSREFHPEGNEVLILLAALILLLAGAGQFIAAVRNPRAYAASFGCAAGALVYGTVAGMAGSDALSSFKLPAGPGVSLLLAVASLMIAVLPPSHRNNTLLWSAQALLGGIAGYSVGGACVTTRCYLHEPAGGQVTRAQVEVHILGVCVSHETGLVAVPDDRSVAIRAVSLAQSAWVYGTSAAGAIAGILAALGIAALLVKRAAAEVRPEPLAANDRPREHGPPSDHIKPA